MAETPEQKYDRIAAAVQQTILNNFPNPDRIGCPGDARVREVAARRTIVEDDDWQHITHCSVCYAEFLATKEQIRRTGHRERTLGLIGGAVVIVALVGVTGYRYFGQPSSGTETASVAFAPATLNLKDSSTIRGDGTGTQATIPELPRRPLDLKIILPFGSEAGTYEFKFIDPNGRNLTTGAGNATILNGETTLKTRLDASNLSSGTYRFGLRQGSFEWVLFAFRFR